MLQLVHNVGTQAAVLQRTEGAATLGLRFCQGRPRLFRLYQQGACKIRLPKPLADDAIDAILINTSGGLTGGDRLRWSIELEPRTRAVVTTQACEKYYRSIGGTVDVGTHIGLGDDTALAWVPQESILFDGSSLTRRLDADIAENARFLAVESVIFGRRAMGETVRRAFLSDRWRVRRNGRLLHAEDLKLSGDIDTLLNRASVAGGATAIATVLVTFPDCGELLPSLRNLLDSSSGASHVKTGAGDKIVVRIAAPTGFLLRRRLIPILDLSCRAVAGRNQQLPKIWTM